MSTFSRTKSGIANTHKFHGADFTVYVEGKVDENGSAAPVTTNDICYFEFLLLAAKPKKIPKIKCVGNKESAFAYAKKIEDEGIPNSIVIVDKDLEEITSSPIPSGCLIRTYGYSWENELWSANTIKGVLDDLTNASTRARSEVDQYFPALLRRLKYISTLDIGVQTHGASLFNGTTSLRGVHYRYPYMSISEIRRFSGKFRASPASLCPIARATIQFAGNQDQRRVVQGHLWSAIAIRFLVDIFRRVTGDSCPSNSTVLRLALSQMRRDAVVAVGGDMISRYQAELARCGV